MSKHLNNDQKVKILLANAKHKGPSSISKELKIPKHTIDNFIKRYQNRGTIVNNYKANKPNSIDARTERRLVRTTLANRRATSRLLKEMLELDCSERAIRNVLKKNGIHARMPLQKPSLNAKQHRWQ